jgi:cysteine desulfurase/selenocysteine lyase
MSTTDLTRTTPRWVRDEFEVCRRLTYLDVAGRAPMADRVHRELTDYLTVCRTEGARKGEWLARVEAIRERTASFIGAGSDEIAFTKNTSDGLNTIAAALDLRAGDNVIVCPEFEHVNNIYPWLHLGERGVETRTVPMRGAMVEPQDVAAHMDERTRVVTVSAVSSWTGARPDLPAIAKLCRDRGVFLLADAAQSLGIVNTDVRELGVDGLAGATQKGLLGMYGLGILYCRREWLPRLRPPFLSVSGVTRAGLHESDLGPLAGYRLHDTAARFETGNPNFAGLFALDAALSLLEEVGAEAVESRVTTLAAQLIGALRDRGLPVITPDRPGTHAGIVAFDVPDVNEADQRLRDNAVRLSVRRGRLRASLHIYNDESDLDRLLSLVGINTPSSPVGFPAPAQGEQP